MGLLPLEPNSKLLLIILGFLAGFSLSNRKNPCSSDKPFEETEMETFVTSWSLGSSKVLSHDPQHLVCEAIYHRKIWPDNYVFQQRFLCYKLCGYDSFAVDSYVGYSRPFSEFTPRKAFSYKIGRLLSDCNSARRRFLQSLAIFPVLTILVLSGGSFHSIPSS